MILRRLASGPRVVLRRRPPVGFRPVLEAIESRLPPSSLWLGFVLDNQLLGSDLVVRDALPRSSEDGSAERDDRFAARRNEANDASERTASESLRAASDQESQRRPFRATDVGGGLDREGTPLSRLDNPAPSSAASLAEWASRLSLNEPAREAEAPDGASVSGLAASPKRWHGIAYNPTWIGWAVGDGQLSDADFANTSFQAMWNLGLDPSGQKYRNDLGTMSAHGFDLVRLYDWGPTRGWDTATMRGTEHDGFLNRAQALGMKVIVPVSNYFLSNDQYAWNGSNPNAAYDFASAPVDIQGDLDFFVGSVTPGGSIHPAVHSILVGNEIDLGDLNDVDGASRLARGIWWIKNLAERLNLSATSTAPMLSLGAFSNADQGEDLCYQDVPANQSWFQEVIHGTSAGDHYPHNYVGADAPRSTAQPGSPEFESECAAFRMAHPYAFTFAVTGLATTRPDYASWYYHSYNEYQYDAGLTELLTQYDSGGATTGPWPQQWPAEQFDVPLLITETGQTRAGIADPEAYQFDIVVNRQAQLFEDYFRAHPDSKVMGYTIFEFSDEPAMGGSAFGIYMLQTDATYGTPPGDVAPSGTVLYETQTGETVVNQGGLVTWASITYPVYQLYPVQYNDGMGTLQVLPVALLAVFMGS